LPTRGAHDVVDEALIAGLDAVSKKCLSVHVSI
jgi:hypothetical protein